MRHNRGDLRVGCLITSRWFENEHFRGADSRDLDPFVYEVTAIEERLGEEFATLRPLRFGDSDNSLLIRVSEVLQWSWEMVQTIRPPSFFQVGSEYRIVLDGIYFRVVSKDSEGMSVIYIGVGTEKVRRIRWESICGKACEELAPHPDNQEAS
tara:strand:- start:741 stop:1199 length:459 start_codon:yes stop_codon:yes gene_type:complete